MDIILINFCKICAACCKRYPFVELSPKEILSIEKVTGLCSEVFVNQKGENVEEYFLKFQDNGYCFFLNEENGSFFCEVYAARPLICKNFPSEPSQQDVCNANSERLLGNTCGSPRNTTEPEMLPRSCEQNFEKR
jgi:Fe-S-cluster containining protein